jgi:hypothetical protein
MPFTRDVNETKFLPIEEDRFPVPGDLIYARDRGAVNIVLSVSEPSTRDSEYYFLKSKEYVYVRSVRYGLLHAGNFMPVEGKRSRSITWVKNDFNSWIIAKQYHLVPVDNLAKRLAIVDKLKDVVTCWTPNDVV